MLPRELVSLGKELPATTPAALKPSHPRTKGAKTGVKATPVTAPAAA
jgi:hypothetical protein